MHTNCGKRYKALPAGPAEAPSSPLLTDCQKYSIYIAACLSKLVKQAELHLVLAMQLRFPFPTCVQDCVQEQLPI